MNNISQLQKDVLDLNNVQDLDKEVCKKILHILMKEKENNFNIDNNNRS